MKKKTQTENYKNYCVSKPKNTEKQNKNITEKITRGRQINIFPKKINERKMREQKRLNSNYNNIRKFQIRENNNSNNSSFNSFSDNNSISSNEIRKKNFFEEESFNYPTKNEVGLYSSDEDSPEFEINLENQIECLIKDIYYRNFPKKINLNNSNYLINKNKKEAKLKKGEFEILKYELKSTFKKLNENYNIFVLKVLSKKIKECVNNFRDKLFENPEFSEIKNSYLKKEELKKKTNKLFKEYCSLEMINEKQAKKNNSPINKKNNISEQIISDILIRDLERIKTCLINSSNEIKEIFQYPLNLLNKSFNIENIQLEAFKKYILNDKLISTIFLQIKLLYNKNKLDSKIKLIQLIENDERYCKREMTKFDNYLDEKIKEENNLNSEEEIDNKSYYNSDSENEIKNHIRKNFLSLSSFSSIETKISPLNDEINENIINEEENKILSNDIDIDDLVKYIDNDDEVIKKKKKKKNKKKNKNKNIINNLQDNKEEKEDNINFENIFLKFKQDIQNDTLDYYKTQKLKSNLSFSFLMKLYTDERRK
jgi:hypothetical protein